MNAMQKILTQTLLDFSFKAEYKVQRLRRMISPWIIKWMCYCVLRAFFVFLCYKHP